MLKEIIIQALKALSGNKMRSSLSALGIIIGVFTIVIVTAIGAGVQKAINDQFSFLNVTTLVVAPVDTSTSKSKLKQEDIDYVLKKSKNIKIGTPLYFGKTTVVVNKEKRQYNIMAGNDSFYEAFPMRMAYGRFYNTQEAISGKRVVIIGKKVIDDLFNGNMNSVGKHILIGGKDFTIIGVMAPSSGVGALSFDDSVTMPINTSNKFLSSTREPTAMIFLATNLESVKDGMDDLKKYLREAHNLKGDGNDDFYVEDQGSILIMARAAADVTKYLLIGIGAIVLVVSGIGIMNIMYAGVAERRREIGIMKSIGARKKDILLQFLIESIILTIIGGLVGIILGETMILLFNSATPYTIIRSDFGMILSLIFAMIIGVSFGIYPANKAANLDPVDALKNS
ncbi:ABC transporter permease [Candidatus Gracilibacteria bacterium]|nr:ABC transporter permease [Candidatus Gracilibacteria bacterium]